MPLEIKIQLDNPNRSYFSGQEVSGKVKVVLTERPKVIQGIKLKLRGKAKTQWKNSSGHVLTTRHFSEEEIYIDKKVYLFGYERDGSEMTLETGSYNYNFNFLLPQSLPSSVSLDYGGIKYYLQATIIRNGKANYTQKLPFTVNSILDLNYEPEAISDGEISKEKRICCFCCTTGPLGFQFKIAKKGFVPGEKIGFQFHMYNHSKKTVNSTSVTLIQELTFIADTNHCKSKTIKICDIKGPKLLKGETADWTVPSDVSTLILPSLPPSRLGGCGIIHISYLLMVKMEVKDSSTVKEYLPIIIGTIPLRESANYSFSVISSNSNPLSLQYPDFPPPSYEEL